MSSVKSFMFLIARLVLVLGVLLCQVQPALALARNSYSLGKLSIDGKDSTNESPWHRRVRGRRRLEESPHVEKGAASSKLGAYAVPPPSLRTLPSGIPAAAPSMELSPSPSFRSFLQPTTTAPPSSPSIVSSLVNLERVTSAPVAPTTTFTVLPLSGFSMVVATHNIFDQVDQGGLTKTLQDYLTAGMMETYPKTESSTLEASPSPNQSGGIDYTGSVVFSDIAAPSVEDVHDREQELLLAFSAVQAAVDGNPAIAQNARVEQVIARDKSVVALADFTISVTTSDTTDPLDQAQLTKTLEDYLTTAIIEEYSNALVVTLNGSPNLTDPNDAVDYTSCVIISGILSPAEDVQALVRELLLDLTAVQTAVDGNPDIGQDAQVEQIIPGESDGHNGSFTSAVYLPAFTIVVNTSDSDGAVELTITLEDYLAARIMEAYSVVASVMLNGSPNLTDPNDAVDYTSYAIISGIISPASDVQGLVEELLLDLTAVQTAVDGNPAIGQDAQVEQIISGEPDGHNGSFTSAVYLPAFNIVVNISDSDGAVDQAQLTMTLEDYLAARIMEEYSVVAAVTLNSSPNLTDYSVDYTSHVIISGIISPASDVQGLLEELLLDLTAVQTALDGNPAIGKDAQVEKVTVVGIGNSGPSISTLIPTPTPPTNRATGSPSTRTDTGMPLSAPTPTPISPTDTDMPTRMPSGTPPTDTDTDMPTKMPSPTPRITDMPAGSPSPEMDTEIPTFSAPSPTSTPLIDTNTDMPTGALPTDTDTSTVALPAFTIIVKTSDNDDPVHQAQLTMTLQDYLMAGIMEAYPSVVAVILNGTPNQMDPTKGVDYTGFVVFSGAAPPAGDVQALVQELLLDLTAVQTAVDGNPAIGQDALVQQVTFDGSGGEGGVSTSTVALPNLSLVVTSDETDTVDVSQLTKTFEDYLIAGIMKYYPSAVAVTLDGSQTQIDGSDVVYYTGYFTVFNMTSRSAQDVEFLVKDLMFDLTNVQAAVHTNSAIGQNVRVEQVVVGDDSVVALADFTLVIRSDDINAVDHDQLARTLEGYLMTRLIQDFSGVKAVVLQPQQSQRSDTIFFSGFAMFVGSVPDFRDVQSRAREALRDTRAVQAAVNSNPAIGGNVSVSGVAFEGPVGNDDNDEINTAAIVGGIVGASAFFLALAVIFRARGRRNPETDTGNNDGNNEDSPLAPLMSDAMIKSQQDAAAPVID